MWKLIVSVPDHCPFIYFVKAKHKIKGVAVPNGRYYVFGKAILVDG